MSMSFFVPLFFTDRVLEGFLTHFVTGFSKKAKKHVFCQNGLFRVFSKFKNGQNPKNTKKHVFSKKRKNGRKWVCLFLPSCDFLEGVLEEFQESEKTLKRPQKPVSDPHVFKTSQKRPLKNTPKNWPSF